MSTSGFSLPFNDAIAILVTVGSPIPVPIIIEGNFHTYMIGQSFNGRFLNGHKSPA
jgi:hypothetical protein